MTKKTRKAGNNKGQTQLERMQEKLPLYLFNAEVLRFPAVTVPLIQKHMFAKSKTTVYRLLKDIKLDKVSIKDENTEQLSNEEVGNYLVDHLTVRQAFSLYDWALSKRFDKQVEKAKRTGEKVKRGYGANGPVKREKVAVKKNDEDKKQEAELVAQAINHSAITGEQQPGQNVDNSTQGKLKSAILNRDLQADQATTIAETILNGQAFSELNGTQSAFIDMMKHDEQFNEYQWSIDWLYKHSLSNNSVQAEFYRLATGQENTGNVPEAVGRMLIFYRNNAERINLNKVGDSIDY